MEASFDKGRAISKTVGWFAVIGREVETNAAGARKLIRRGGGEIRNIKEAMDGPALFPWQL